MNSEKNNIDMSNVINKLFEGDCLEYMKKIPDGSVDMILCDLPYGMTQNKWDSYIPLDELWKQYNRIIKPDGAIVLEPYDKGIRKNQLSGNYGDFEPVHVASDGDRYPTDVIYIKTAESEGAVLHPTQKPIELGRYMVRTYTNPGDIVLDNTFGSGSFLVAALMEGRNFIGIEKNEDVALFKKEEIDYILEDFKTHRIEK